MSEHTLTKASLVKQVPSFENRKIIVIGDVMLDRYIMGTVERISPEAPVPVVLTSSSSVHLGGAGNVARNIRSLGGCPVLFSICGRDAEAILLKQRLEIEGIEGICIEDPTRPTTSKTRVIAHNQQVVRIDDEVTIPAAPAITGKLLTALQRAIEPGCIILISDYAKGTITPGFMDSLQSIIRSCAVGCKVLVDPKPRHFPLYKNSYLLTPNAKEAEQGANLPPLKAFHDIITVGSRILETVHCENVLITLGREGMVLFEGIDKIWHIPAMSQTVYDVTGAGDTVIALMALSVASGLSLLEASVLSNYAAGIVVGEVGAAVVSPQKLANIIASWELPCIRSIQ